MEADSSSGGTSHVTVGDAWPQGCSGPLGQGEESLAPERVSKQRLCPELVPTLSLSFAPTMEDSAACSSSSGCEADSELSSAESTEDRGGFRADAAAVPAPDTHSDSQGPWEQLLPL